MINIGTFKALRDYVKGKISAGELESVEKAFVDVREKPKRGESIIEVEFQNSEDFLRKLGMTDDDIWRLNRWFGAAVYDPCGLSFLPLLHSC